MSKLDRFCRMCKLAFNPLCGLCLKNDNHFNPFSSQRNLFDKFLWTPKRTILVQSIAEIVKVISCHDKMLRGFLCRILGKMTSSTETLFIMTFKNMTLSIRAFSEMTISTNNTQHYNTQHHSIQIRVRLGQKSLA